MSSNPKWASKTSPRKSKSSLGQTTSTTSRKQTDESKTKNEEEETESLIERCASSVHSACPNAAYPACVWSREHLLKSPALTKIAIQRHHPHGVSELASELTLIGKTRYVFRNAVSDKLGQAKKSTQQLEIDHLGRTVCLDSFVILGFDSVGCFQWTKSLRWALKLGYDVQKQEIIYMSRKSELNRNVNRLKVTPVTHSSSPPTDIDLLCLKASPKPLKHLVRDYLRARAPLSHDNLHLDRFDLLLESTLLSFLKYSSRLKLGAELRLGESLVSAARNYRLSLEHDGRLVLYLDSSRLRHLYLFSQVDSLWFYDLAVVVSHRNSLRASPFPNAHSATLITEFVSRLAWCKSSLVMRLTDRGTLEIGSREHDSKLVVQYRDDLRSMWNAVEPKSECMCYMVKKSPNEDDDDDDDDDDEDDDEDESSDDDEEDDNDDDNNIQTGRSNLNHYG